MFVILELGPWNEPDLCRQIIYISHKQISGGIERVAAPIQAADISRDHQGTAQAGRREDAFVAQRRETLQARLPPLRTLRPRCLNRKFLWNQSWRRQWKGLGGRRPFS